VLRAVLEGATHRVVVRRRLPQPFSAARIYASTEGGLGYLRLRMASVAPELLRLAEEVVKPGDVVWDIGANLGLFSFAAAVQAGPSGRVLAVEPDSVLVGLLRRSAAANQRCAPVDVLPVAVADDLGVARFNIGRRNRSTNHLDGFGTSEAGGVRASELVPVVTLDWLAGRFPAPSVVKIDVEEAEVQVLTGGTRVLRMLPSIICEVAARNAEAVSGLLTPHGYLCYDGDQPAGQRVPLTNAPPNTLAVGPARHPAQRDPVSG
jgi:FkbM family methyltransferase